MVLHAKIRVGILLVLFGSALYLLWMVRGSLYPFLFALLMAYLLNPTVCWFEQRGVKKRLWAILLVYALMLVLAVIAGSKVLPLFIRELDGFARDLPRISAQTQQTIKDVEWQYQNTALPHSIRLVIDQQRGGLENLVRQTIADVFAALITLATHGISLFISPILAFYLLHDWQEIKEKLYGLIPAKWRPEMTLFLTEIDAVFNGVIRGQIIIAALVGILVTVGLTILKIKYAILIGVLAGVLDVIPYFGAVIGAVPAVVVGLLESKWLAVKVVVLFFLVHQFESCVISPRILSEKTGLHPISVIFFLFLGGELAGIPGMLLGVPAAAVMKVILRHAIKLLI